MSKVQDQIPSPWAVKLPVWTYEGNEVNLWWDYLYHDIFAWNRGVFLIWRNHDGIHERIAMGEQRPPSYDGDIVGELIAECVLRFNDALDRRFPEGDAGPHPVNQATYETLKTALIWEESTHRFK